MVRTGLLHIGHVRDASMESIDSIALLDIAVRGLHNQKWEFQAGPFRILSFLYRNLVNFRGELRT